MDEKKSILESPQIPLVGPGQWGQNLAIIGVVALLMACSTGPDTLKGAYAPIEPQATTIDDLGREVRWGGMIHETTLNPQQTCFEVLYRELDRFMKPRKEEPPQGLFVACRNGSLDPEVIAKGREITLTGTVAALDERKVDEYELQYPILAAGIITLWPDRSGDLMIWNHPLGQPWGTRCIGSCRKAAYQIPPAGGSDQRDDVHEDSVTEGL